MFYFPTVSVSFLPQILYCIVFMGRTRTVASMIF